MSRLKLDKWLLIWTGIHSFSILLSYYLTVALHVQNFYAGILLTGTVLTAVAKIYRFIDGRDNEILRLRTLYWLGVHTVAFWSASGIVSYISAIAWMNLLLMGFIVTVFGRVANYLYHSHLQSSDLKGVSVWILVFAAAIVFTTNGIKLPYDRKPIEQFKIACKSGQAKKQTEKDLDVKATREIEERWSTTRDFRVGRTVFDDKSDITQKARAGGRMPSSLCTRYESSQCRLICKKESALCICEAGLLDMLQFSSSRMAASLFT